MGGTADQQAAPDYGPLVKALAREGLQRRTQAVQAVEAVACALGGRLADPAFEPLRELLPEPFRGRLVACEDHAGIRKPPPGSAERFFTVVGDHLGQPADEVEHIARAVFAALRSQLDEDQAEEVALQFPAELLPLWRRPS